MISEDLRSVHVQFQLALGHLVSSKPLMCICVVWVKSELVAGVRLLPFQCDVKAPPLPQTITVLVPTGSRVFWSDINISHLQQVEATLLRTAPSPKLPSYRVLLRFVIGTPGSSLSC